MGLNEKVLVTGGTGHVGFTLTKQLIKSGYNVRTTVRDPTNKARNAHLEELNVEIVEADLLKPESWKSAMDDIEGVFQVAAPYSFRTRDPQKELIDPTLIGTLNVLKAAHYAQVKRIVFTSTALTVGTKTEPDKPFTEDHWNDNDKIPYIYAKTRAEQKAWEFAKDKELDLVTILPTGVIGPNFYRYTPSTIGFRDYVQGTVGGISPGIFNYVDVRDVAKAHILAYENPNARGRYICGTEAYSVKEIFEKIQSEFPEMKFPTRKLSSFVINLFALFSRRLDRTEVNMFMNFRLFYDTSKIRTDLGWTPRPIEETLRDTINWIRATPITYMAYYQ